MNAWLQLPGQCIEVDCLWRAERLALELDSRSVHATDAAFERDRARDRRLQVAGWRPIRVTWRQLHDDPRAVEKDIRALLGSAPAQRWSATSIYQRTSCHSITPWPDASRSPPGSSPWKLPNGCR